MVQVRRSASLLFSLSMVAAAAFAQPGAQDGAQRNLLERDQQEAEFHVRLYDARVPKPTSGPSLPLPLETAPRSTLHLSEPLAPNPTEPAEVPPPLSGSSARLQKDLDQQQRLQQLQMQNQQLDETVRQQQIQIQQLQFDRENSAQSLHDRIMRDSQGAIRQGR
jgi:hypothetical protein